MSTVFCDNIIKTPLNHAFSVGMLPNNKRQSINRDNSSLYSHFNVLEVFIILSYLNVG